MTSLASIPLFERVATAERVLIAGAGGEMFVNPLMAMYFAFDLDAVVRRSLYLPLLEGTKTMFEVASRIEGFRHTVKTRPHRSIPH